jgi:hypothetical protein
MTSEREEWIRRFVARFREAAIRPEMKRYAGYYSFPWGSCTWASYALGHLLAEQEPDADWHVMNAEGPSSLQGHDWLESGGLGVDVTADQFRGFAPYVGPIPVPLPPEYRPKQRIELAEWHPAHSEALLTLRELM